MARLRADEGTGRILIRIRDSQPQPRFEQWIQIAIKGSTNELGRNVDFIAVQLLDDTSKDLTPRVVTFRGYSRTPKGFVLEGPGSSPRRDLSKCYSCHPNGLRAIIPAPSGPIKSDGPMTKPTLADVTKVTSEGTKLAVLGPRGYTASENGPPLGPSTRPGRDQFVANGLKARGPRTAVPGCAAGLTEPRRQAIVAQMNCERCHDSETDRASLNAGTSIETLNHKVVENTVAPMPPPVTWARNPSLKLSPSEREVLFKCLKAEYAEILQEWLTSDLLIVP